MKSLTGVVTSTKMQKTIMVTVSSQWNHPVYKKMVTRTKKYPVHDAQSLAKVGDRVIFSECRPLSKTVHFNLNKVLDESKA